MGKMRGKRDRVGPARRPPKRGKHVLGQHPASNRKPGDDRNRACPTRDCRWLGGRSRQQRGKQRGVRFVQAGRVFVEQKSRRRCCSLQFTAEVREVQIGFENLLLVPVSFELERSSDLRELLANASPTG